MSGHPKAVVSRLFVVRPFCQDLLEGFQPLPPSI